MPTWPRFGDASPASGIRQPAIRLAYAQHPNPAQSATVDRTASLGNPIADRRAVYVADTRARYGHTVHLAREDLGTDGTDEDRLARYAETISNARSRHASLHYARRHEREGPDRVARRWPPRAGVASEEPESGPTNDDDRARHHGAPDG